MKIAIIGYGKMGQVIEKIAIGRGHEISLKLSSEDDINQINTENTDVAVEFTNPKSAYNNIEHCIKSGVPVISGSTGWLDKFDNIKELTEIQNGAFFYASNFSVGVNIFFRLNEILAKMMNPMTDYKISMEEIHHTEKKDSPSGTGITLAEGIISQNEKLERWVNEPSSSPKELQIISKRIDKVPGTHTIKYDSPVDSIEITHTAHSREGFGLGSVLAAEWIIGKKGVFGMNDMIKL